MSNEAAEGIFDRRAVIPLPAWQPTERYQSRDSPGVEFERDAHPPGAASLAKPPHALSPGRGQRWCGDSLQFGHALRSLATHEFGGRLTAPDRPLAWPFYGPIALN